MRSIEITVEVQNIKIKSSRISEALEEIGDSRTH